MIRKLGAVELTVPRLVPRRANPPKGNEQSFEQWVSNRFGRRLFELFFRSYTEKVLGRAPTSSSAPSGAAQRIKGLSFSRAPPRPRSSGNNGNKVKSLIQEFHYPRYGPGQMWETMTDEIRALGGEVRLDTPVTELALEATASSRLAGAEIFEPSAR